MKIYLKNVRRLVEEFRICFGIDQVVFNDVPVDLSDHELSDCLDSIAVEVCHFEILDGGRGLYIVDDSNNVLVIESFLLPSPARF